MYRKPQQGMGGPFYLLSNLPHIHCLCCCHSLLLQVFDEERLHTYDDVEACTSEEDEGYRYGGGGGGPGGRGGDEESDNDSSSLADRSSHGSGLPFSRKKVSSA